MEPQEFSVHFISHAESLDFADDILQHFRVFEGFANSLGIIRETTFSHIKIMDNGKESCFSGFIAQILPQIPKLCRQFCSFIFRHLSCTVWGKIFSLFHKRTDAAFYLFP